MADIYGQLIKSQFENLTADPGTQPTGLVWLRTDTSPPALKFYDGATLQTLASLAAAQTLTNKTIAGANNTLTVRLANDVTGTLPEGNGGTNQTTYTLGDLLYASAANTLAKLAGNTTSTNKLLAQTGNGSVSAAPGWVTLVAGDIPNLAASKITSGTLAVAQGGTNLASGTSGGILGYTASGTLASSAALTANGVVIGGGAGATPTATAAGTNGQLLVGVTSGAPAWGSTVSAATTFSGGVVFGNGGTNINWYEEGTFTPTVAATGTSGTITYGSQVGSFTRIGRTVRITIYVTWTNWTGSPTGVIQLGGLPYTQKNTTSLLPTYVVITDNVAMPSGTLWICGQGTNNTATINLSAAKATPGVSSANSVAIDPASNSGSATRAVYLSGTYEV